MGTSNRSDEDMKFKKDLPSQKKKVNSFAGEGSFYELWDKDMTQAIKNRNPMWWDGGWTNIHRGRGFGVNFDAQALYEQENNEFVKKTSAVEGQADENAKIAFEYLEKWTLLAAIKDRAQKNAFATI